MSYSPCAKLPCAKLVLALVLLLLLLPLCSLARAEVLLLVDGGQVEGTLLNPGEEPRVNYVLRTDSGVQLTLAPDRVEQLIEETDIRRRYEEFLAKLPDSAAAHWDMAQRCAQAGLKEEREFHLQRVLKFEPEHVDARHALGYSQVDGRWVKMEEFRRKQGYVRDRGGWRLEQERELLASQEERELEVKDWKKKLKLWRTWLIKGRGKEAEALAHIRSIDRKRAAPALADQLKEEEEYTQLKLVYIDVLGKLDSQVAVSAFIDRAILDPDAVVRDRCLDELVKFGGEAAAQDFIKKLKDDNNVIVNRAAYGLARLKDDDATLPLIEALTTKHRQVISRGGGNLGVGFSPGGVNGLSAGGRGPTVLERELRNQSVLGALTQIHEGVNFAYNKEAWRNWYAVENTPRGVNLHRLD